VDEVSETKKQEGSERVVTDERKGNGYNRWDPERHYDRRQNSDRDYSNGKNNPNYTSWILIWSHRSAAIDLIIDEMLRIA